MGVNPLLRRKDNHKREKMKNAEHRYIAMSKLPEAFSPQTEGMTRLFVGLGEKIDRPHKNWN